MVSSNLNSKQLYLRLLGHVRPYWRVFSLSILALVVTSATEPAVAALFKPLLDESFVSKDPTGLVWMPLALVGLFTLRGLSGYVADMAMAWVAGKLVFDLRQLMFERLLTLPTPYYDQHASGTLISKVNYDVTQVTEAATNVLTVLVRDSLTIVGLMAWMLYLNWQLTLITFAIAPPIVALVYVVNRRIRGLARSLQQTYGKLTGVLQEVTEGHRVVKVFGGEDYERGRFSKVSNWLRRYQMKVKSAANLAGPISQIAAVIGLALIVFLASRQAAAGELTVGGFVSFIGAMGLLLSPIKRLTGINERMQKGLAAAESVFGLIDEVPEPQDGQSIPGRAGGELEFRDVSFHYHAGEGAAVGGVSFRVAPGETLALVGPSGSGKSTVASLIPRFYELDQGHVLLDGSDIGEMRLRDLRAQISLVSQDVLLFNDSVAANIAYGSGAASDRAAIESAARAANALDFINNLPKGLDTTVGDKGIRLSGGQRQRIAIARALLKDAPVLILDEATSALDSESERTVQEALERLRAGRTTLVIAHRLSTIERADRILVLEAGRVVESGAHAELLAAGGLYADLYRIQYAQLPARELVSEGASHDGL
jgi:subfamily B ATP-binding cassette protein MsbA